MNIKRAILYIVLLALVSIAAWVGWERHTSNQARALLLDNLTAVSSLLNETIHAEQFGMPWSRKEEVIKAYPDVGQSWERFEAIFKVEGLRGVLRDLEQKWKRLEASSRLTDARVADRLNEEKKVAAIYRNDAFNLASAILRRVWSRDWYPPKNDAKNAMTQIWESRKRLVELNYPSSALVSGNNLLVFASVRFRTRC